MVIAQRAVWEALRCAFIQSTVIAVLTTSLTTGTVDLESRRVHPPAGLDFYFCDALAS